MKRFHVHVGVHDLNKSIRFYSALFATEPTVRKDDYAKWQIDDPRINFAISTRPGKGVDHLGFQAENAAELEEIASRLAQADVAMAPQKGVSCCYAKSDKYWTIDPQGVAWESFHTLDSAPVFGNQPGRGREKTETACCSPSQG
ncbi:MAG TPA: ArsI/CadI family heavy metal resistance metalloenzyme [Burkholderiales bacterium]|nr:ArsI/CadI family heavy metal resistance metalloenzyme [Burkholderiales bacterium]